MTDTTPGAPAPIPDPKTTDGVLLTVGRSFLESRRGADGVAPEFYIRRYHSQSHCPGNFADTDAVLGHLIDRVRAAEAEVEKLRAEVNRLKDRSPLLVLDPGGTPSHMLHRMCDADLGVEAHGPERESGRGRPLAAPRRHLGHLLRFFIERHMPDLRDYVLMSLAAQDDPGLTDADRRKLLAIATDQRAFEELMRATAMLLVEDVQRGIEQLAPFKAPASKEVAILRARVAELEAPCPVCGGAGTYLVSRGEPSQGTDEAICTSCPAGRAAGWQRRAEESVATLRDVCLQRDAFAARVAGLEAENARFLGIIARGEDMFRRYDDLVRGYTETIDRLTGRKDGTT